METNGSIDAGEAAEALASVRHSRYRVAWSGYPAWYWLGTGACLGALTFTMLLPGWWALVTSAGVGGLLVGVTCVARRVRGVCEGWVHGAMTMKESAVLGGPAAALIVLNAVAVKFVSWSTIVAAVLIFVVYAGTGLILGARADRS
jgi:hypothetical protein